MIPPGHNKHNKHLLRLPQAQQLMRIMNCGHTSRKNIGTIFFCVENDVIV